MNLAHEHWELDDLVVVGFHRDRALRASNRNLARSFRQLERVSRCAKMRQDLIVRALSRESHLLSHVILILIKTPVGATDVCAEVCDSDRDEQIEKAPEGARTAARFDHQLLCTPSTIFCTSFVIATLRPSCSSRSA